jgi:hypothetical protein
VADYSEFPTTPTAWQEAQLKDWQTITPLSTEDPEPPRRTLDRKALIPGILFIVVAITAMAGVGFPDGLWEGGFLWLILIGAGVVLLVSELRKARRRRR